MKLNFYKMYSYINHLKKYVLKEAFSSISRKVLYPNSNLTKASTNFNVFKKFFKFLYSINSKGNIRRKKVVFMGLSMEQIYVLRAINLSTCSVIHLRHFSCRNLTPISNFISKSLLLQQARAFSIIVSTKEPDVKTIHKENLVFANPKNILHNCFDVVSHDLKQRDLKLAPTYKIVKGDQPKKASVWMCSYNLKWPETTKFSGIASTKQEAANKVATDILQWLYQNKKITKRGTPIIYENNEVMQLTKQLYAPFELNPSTLINIDTILKGVSKDVQNVIENYEEDSEKGLLEIDEEWPTMFLNRNLPKYKNLEFYLARESVQLPISYYKDNLIKLLDNYNVVIVKGEPGCGKSTRVPQYVLEGWAKSIHFSDCKVPCRIIVTEPRRIAAVSLAERVATERGENVGHTVGYQVRLKTCFDNSSGHILYCTTGILLRRLQSDPKCLDYTHVIIDEAHEREVNIDLIMNLLRQALDLNSNLKVIVMSATIEADKFQNYFNNASVLNIPGFSYPIQEHFLSEKDKFPKTYEMCFMQYPYVVTEDVVKCIMHLHQNKPEGAILCFLPGWEDIIKIKDSLPSKSDLVILCLHSRLDISEQNKIFSKPPPGVRKVILSTNIAETSVTIDDVIYVIDTGIHKEERLDIQTGGMCIDNHWISKASALQRKGRAGRCQPGDCFHLYPKSKYQDFDDYSIPEILRTSLSKIVLDSKVYSNNMNAVEFLQQLICPPNSTAIKKAVEELKELELLDKNENFTPLGRTLSNFQLEPRLSKAMVNAVIFKCVTPILDIVTLYSAKTALFSKGLVDKDLMKQNIEMFSKTSDHLALMQIFEKWLYFVESRDFLKASEFCDDFGLMQAKLITLQKLRNIHFEYLHKGLYDVLPISDDFSDNNELVMAVLLSGVGTVLHQRSWDIIKGRFKKTNVLVTRQNQKVTITSDSVNSRKGKFPLNFLVYINETISNLRHTTLVRETSPISPLSVLLFANSNLEIEQLDKENYSNKLNSDDQVVLKLEGTKIGFLCSRQQAILLQKCKEIINAFRKYYSYQLTTGNNYNSTVNKCWQNTLNQLNALLNGKNVNID